MTQAAPLRCLSLEFEMRRQSLERPERLATTQIVLPSRLRFVICAVATLAQAARFEGNAIEATRRPDLPSAPSKHYVNIDA